MKGFSSVILGARARVRGGEQVWLLRMDGAGVKVLGRVPGPSCLQRVWGPSSPLNQVRPPGRGLPKAVRSRQKGGSRPENIWTPAVRAGPPSGQRSSVLGEVLAPAWVSQLGRDTESLILTRAHRPLELQAGVWVSPAQQDPRRPREEPCPLTPQGCRHRNGQPGWGRSEQGHQAPPLSTCPRVPVSDASPEKARHRPPGWRGEQAVGGAPVRRPPNTSAAPSFPSPSGDPRHGESGISPCRQEAAGGPLRDPQLQDSRRLFPGFVRDGASWSQSQGDRGPCFGL